MPKYKIEINSKPIQIVTDQTDNDFISLTDIAKFKNPNATGIIIANWLSTKYTLEFVGAWEKLHNPNFNVIEFDNIKNQSGSNAFILSTTHWIKATNSIGIKVGLGRYGGGTLAHKDIAFEFATWISVEFKLFLIKEFQRLKKDEQERQLTGWDAKRLLTKINYKIHTDSIKENIILPSKISSLEANAVYANEADLLNKALFGKTASEWRKENKGKVGNVRDYANVQQLICLSNLESINAELIRDNLSQRARLLKLNEVAIIQMKSLQTNTHIKKLIK